MSHKFKWTCQGNPPKAKCNLPLIDDWAAESHQVLFPDHKIVRNAPADELVKASDFGYVVLAGPDGKIKQTTGFG